MKNRKRQSKRSKKNTGKTRNKLVLYFSIAAVVLIAAVAIFITRRGDNEVAGRHNSIFDDNIVLAVNGHPINRREFQFRMERRRGPIIHHFVETYGADETHPEFWLTSFDGITPMEFSRDRTLETVISIKIEQILAMERGLIDDITYEYFLYMLDDENARRLAADEQGIAVQGMLQVSEESFFNSLHYDMVAQLIGQLRIEGVIAPTQDDLMRFYNENIEDFRMQDDLHVQVLYVNYIFGDEESEDIARQIIENLYTQITSAGFDAVLEYVKNGVFDRVMYQAFYIIDDEDADTATFASFWNSILEVNQLPTNVASGIVNNFENLAIMRSTSRIYRGFMPLDDEVVTAWISYRLMHDIYAAFLNQQIAAADIVINYDVFNGMVIPQELW